MLKSQEVDLGERCVVFTRQILLRLSAIHRMHISLGEFMSLSEIVCLQDELYSYHIRGTVSTRHMNRKISCFIGIISHRDFQTYGFVCECFIIIFFTQMT